MALIEFARSVRESTSVPSRSKISSFIFSDGILRLTLTIHSSVAVDDRFHQTQSACCEARIERAVIPKSRETSARFHQCASRDEESAPLHSGPTTEPSS